MGSLNHDKKPIEETVNDSSRSEENRRFEPGRDPIVGVVVDEEAPADRIVRTLEASGATTVVGVASEVHEAEPTFVVATGERGVLTSSRTDSTVPVLAVEAGSGFPSVRTDMAGRAVERVLSGEATTVSRPLLSVDVDGEDAGRALLDVTLVTDEPARISEFLLEHSSKNVARFRADGLVVATPAGSHGYAAAAGGPLLVSESASLVAVPIAPFVTSATRWVFGMDELSLTVVREEGSVELLTDDVTVTVVDPGERVSIRPDGALSFLRVSIE